jgi:type IV pilus assembly protein PilE
MEIRQRGFTLVELVIVVAIIGLLAAIAYPNYQNSVRKAKRSEVQAEMSEIASKLQRYKLANFHYKKTSTAAITLADIGVTGSTPTSQNAAYQYSLAFNSATAPTTWTLTATPTNGQLKGTGALMLTDAGRQCWYKDKDTFTATDVCTPWSGK